LQAKQAYASARGKSPGNLIELIVANDAANNANDGFGWDGRVWLRGVVSLETAKTEITMDHQLLVSLIDKYIAGPG
jgi:hypothetical protein